MDETSAFLIAPHARTAAICAGKHARRAVARDAAFPPLVTPPCDTLMRASTSIRLATDVRELPHKHALGIPTYCDWVWLQRQTTCDVGDNIPYRPKRNDVRAAPRRHLPQQLTLNSAGSRRAHCSALLGGTWMTCYLLPYLCAARVARTRATADCTVRRDAAF